MFCKNCGNEIADNMTFCPKCGTMVNGSVPSQNGSNFYDRSNSTETSKNTVGLTMSIIGAIIYLIGMLVLVPENFTDYFTSSYYYLHDGDLNGVIACSLTALVFSVISLFCFISIKKSRQKINQLGVVGLIVSIVIFIASIVSFIVFFSCAM